MARQPKNAEVEVTPEPKAEEVSKPAETENAPGPGHSTGKQGTDPVEMQDFDRAMHWIGQQFSELKAEYEQRISDLETLVSQPKGSVQFLEVTGQPPEALEPGEDAPWFTPRL